MSDVFPSRPLARDTVTTLVASVGTANFSECLMGFIREAAPIANFGAFLVPNMSRPEPLLSLWAGKMSGYWFNRNAKEILANEDVKKDIIQRIRSAKTGELAIERWRPEPGNPLNPIYMRDEVIERVTISSRSENAGFMSFYLRGKNSGWLRDEEVERLSRVLPLAHELIGLRHQIVGSEAFHYSLESRVTALKDRDVGQFGRLSVREAEVCDLLLKGVGVAGTAVALGISDNSVRTLRKRAYAKLGVHSAMQIAALALNDLS